MSGKEYYLGLDMGVASIGWAVTDKNYNLLRAKGKDLWGIREFDEAETAETRRMHRTSRRRRQREQVRIGLLKEYFHDAIEAIDPYFYQRLENSKYYPKDKDSEVSGKNGIFADRNYEDKDYYKEFPTIFHLRKELIHNNGEHDVRLVYLALLNLFKHRGHFLNEGVSIEGNQKGLTEIYKEFCFLLQEETGVVFDSCINMKQMESILLNRDYSRSRKVEELKKLMHIDKKDKNRAEFIKAMCGLKAMVHILFPDVEFNEDKKVDICFSDFAYEEKVPEIMEAVGEELFEVISAMKEIYDFIVLGNIMKGYQYLSDARVAQYEKHGHDLKVLKKVVLQYKGKKEYDRIFRSNEAGTYSAYVNSVNSSAYVNPVDDSKKIRRNMSGRKYEDLQKTIKKILKDLPIVDEDVVYILNELEKESFLPKQLTSANGVIPNQVHAREVHKILENAERYLGFLKEKDETGLTVSEKIYKLFSFQIPYYVGPTSEDSKTGWVVRRESGMVLPWNMEQKINMNETREQFISRMVRRCSYINGEQVLPMASLEYESFCLLNEINSIAIDGERISVGLKQDIYRELFMTGKKHTRKQLAKYLIAKGVMEDESQLTGVDININSALTTYGKFKNVLGEMIDTDEGKHLVEEIVFWQAVYGDSKKLLKSMIQEKYGAILGENEIKKILGFKSRGWGRLSKEFLEMPGCDISIGEKVSLIRMMWETNLNLMEMINSNRYSYKEELENRQNKQFKTLYEMKPEDLDEYYFSAPVKRMVWQTVLIIRELEQVLGAPPKRLFVEMARQRGEKQRTVSRKQKFLDLYKSVKDEDRDWKKVIEDAEDNGTIRSKKMYLYLTQMGRCMYTGESISLDNLFNDKLYDIDHIYPRHYVKDDNLDNNLVLVRKEKNANKSDEYPLKESIRNSQKCMWKLLKEKSLITEEKYKRLTGCSAFTDEQKADFIARQLVETRQGTKGVADLLKKLLPDTILIYSKASNVAEFRNDRSFIKCRSINEFHHAQDAYLNIVVGNVYYVKFTQNPLNFIKKEYQDGNSKGKYNLSRMFDWDIIRNGEIAWIGSKKEEGPGTIGTVRKMMKKNTPLMTRRNFEVHGSISKETLYGKDKAVPENYIPLKSSDERMRDVKRYGGFTGVSIAYFFLVEHTVKGKRIRTLETVPVYMTEKIKRDKDGLINYCTEILGLSEPNIRMDKIKIQSLMKKDGYFVHISGKTGERIILRNAVNLCLDTKWHRYIKKLEKFSEYGEIREDINRGKNIELYEEIRDKFCNSIYAKRPNPMGEKLILRQEQFEKLDIKGQCKILIELMKLTAIGSYTADLSLIKEAAMSGKMLMPKKINGSFEMKLINQSVTGLYESHTDLLKV